MAWTDKQYPYKRRAARPGRLVAARRWALSGVALCNIFMLGFAAVWLGLGHPDLRWPALPLDQPVPHALADNMAAHFTLCDDDGDADCVVDGDTFWLGGVKYRIADIDTPETHPARCAREAALGGRATQRLALLLNAGPFTLEEGARSSDQYGRALRIVTRNGQSIGGMLVAEGLARRWAGHRDPWY